MPAHEGPGVHGVRAGEYLLADDPKTKGLAWWLACLKQRLEAKQDKARRQLKKLQKKLAKPGLFRRWQRRFFPGAYKRGRLKLTGQAWGARLLLMQLKAEIDLIEQVGERVVHHQQKLQEAIATLEQASQHYIQQEQLTARQRLNRPVFEENVLGAADEEELYTDRIEWVWQRARPGVKMKWPI